MSYWLIKYLAQTILFERLVFFMKKLSILLCVFILVSSLAICANAAPISTDILKGTPIIDGTLDDIYTQSASYEYDNFARWCFGNVTEDTGTRAISYFLWDESNLYICSYVKDATVCSSGSGNNWQNDACEYWLKDDDALFKIHAAGDGHNFFVGKDKDGKASFDFSKALYKTSKVSDGYVVEVALPFTDMKVGRQIGFSLQVCDIIDNSIDNGCAGGSQDSEYKFTMSASEVILPEVKPIISATTENADTAIAPATADYTSVAILVCITFAGMVIASKKHK